LDVQSSRSHAARGDGKCAPTQSAIQASRAALEKAAGTRLVLRAISFPDAGLIGVAGVQGGKRTEQSSTQAFGFVQGNFAQPLFNVAIPASRRRGDLEILIAKQQLNATIIEQLHQARIAFYAALYNRSLESLRRSQAQQLEENVRTQQARFDAGATDRGSVTAATVQARELDRKLKPPTALIAARSSRLRKQWESARIRRNSALAGRRITIRTDALCTGERNRVGSGTAR